MGKIRTNRAVRRSLCVAMWLAIAVVDALAQLPRTRLDAIFPAGGRAGGDVSVAISGELTEAATELVFDHPEIEATQQIDPPTEYTVAHRKARNFDVRIGPGVPDGRYEMRAFGPTGLSGPRAFMVSRLREIQFDPAENSRANPFAIAIGDVVNAKARNDQRDYYQFTATQGTSVLVQVWAERIDSRMDAVLSIYEASTGQRVERLSQGTTRDPVLVFHPPADADYVIEVHDATYRGGDEYLYRLEVSTRAHVETVHPIVARHGRESRFTVLGFNLPGGVPVSGGEQLGNLQSLQVSFAPDFESGSFVAGLPLGNTAAARINGATVSLPIPLSASRVFLARAEDEVILEASNDSAEHAQSLDVPCTVAGQFYPRRDVDWYSFKAKKNQRFWIELATQQLGTHSDPILRVRRQTTVDGNPNFEDVASADDIEGVAGSRDARRFYSGTSDSAYRFSAPEDGTYVVSVTDQYNSSSDDPRLVYQLSIKEEAPDFQLLAFADPERHSDEKISRPNGVSLLPGGSAIVRVRMLPHHGFNQPIRVTAENLPAGVSAHALVLSERQKEGFLVLAASADAKEGLEAVRIVGVSRLGEAELVRVARNGAIVRGVENADADQTRARLTEELPVAVVSSTSAPAVTFDPLMPLVTSVGGKLKLSMRFARQDSQKDKELQVEAAILPKGIKLAAAKTKTNQVDVVATFEDAGLPPGRYAIPLATKVKEKRPRNVVEYRQAEADLEKVSSVLTQRDADLQFKQHVSSKLTAVLNRVQQLQASIQSNVASAQQTLAAKLTDQLAVVTDLAEKLKASAAAPGDNALRAAVKASELRLEQIQSQRDEVQQQVAAVVRPVGELSELADQLQAELDLLQQTVADLQANRDEAATKKQEAEKRLDDVRNAQLQKEAEYWIYSPSVEVEVRSSPLSFLTGKAMQVHAGEAVEVPISVHRNFGFDGQVTLEATFPNESGLTASSLVLGKGQQFGRLRVAAKGHAKTGTWTGAINSRIKFNAVEIRDELTCVLEVKAKEPPSQ